MINKYLTKLSFALFIFLSGCTCNTKDVYLFSYFINGGQDGLHLAYSYDGLQWDKLNNGESLLKPMIGKDRLMRDPSIAQGKDGVFHMVWTTGWWDKGIGYASSTDLINWSEQQYIPVMEHLPTTKNSWAPEVFYDNDEDLFYIIWASTVPELYPEIETLPNEKGLNHRQYYTTTKDFISFAPTQLFFDPGFSVIDAAILKRKSDYLMVVKNEMSAPVEKNLRLTFTKHLKDGFPTEVTKSVSGNSWVEGPTPLQLGDYIYIYFDKYREKKYGAIRSLDGENWEDVSETINLPKGIRHGTAFKTSEDILNKLLSLSNSKE
nr:glycoside hydrolase family 43 protein [uncultured Carboxylicivirga sp.]